MRHLAAVAAEAEALREEAGLLAERRAEESAAWGTTRPRERLGWADGAALLQAAVVERRHRVAGQAGAPLAVA
jgi:hypothetical protein